MTGAGYLGQLSFLSHLSKQCFVLGLVVDQFIHDTDQKKQDELVTIDIYL